MKIITGLFKTYEEADQAVAKLFNMGYSYKEMSVVGQEKVLQHEDHSYAAEDAGKGAGIGGLVGLLVGAAPLVVPGIGAVVGAGTILAGVFTGAGVGAVTGGLVGLFEDAFRNRDSAERFATAIGEGNIMLAVRSNDKAADQVSDIMRMNDAYEVEVHSFMGEKQRA